MRNNQFRWFKQKKECNVLTWKATILLLFVFLSLSVFVFFRVSFFLSSPNPLQGEFLVLDGHLPDFAIEEAIEIFNKGSYSQVITTGGNLPSGYYISELKTMAELSYATFLKLGFDSTKISVIPGGKVLRDRTYTSGVSLKKWLQENKINSAKVDVLAIGCHARRSQFLFGKALGDNFEVGVVSINDPSFDSRYWWKSSRGFRTVVNEAIAYLYVVLFFWPE